MTTPRTLGIGLLVIASVAAATAAGCASATVRPSGASSAVGAPSTVSSAVSPSSGAVDASSAASAAPAASPFTSSRFAIPLTVVAAPSLGAGSPMDSPGLLSWTSPTDDNDRVRFLVPVEVYPPGATTPSPVPADVVAYLKGLVEHGAVITDVTTTTVGGKPATLLTATSTESLDGSIGCPEKGADRGEGCFGLQPDLLLRVAVVDVDGTPLIAWARTDAIAPNQAFVTAFEDMLATVTFP